MSLNPNTHPILEVIEVLPDGSGEVLSTVYMSQAMAVGFLNLFNDKE